VITVAEAYFDTDRGYGKGLQLLPVDGAFDSPEEKVYGLVPLAQLKIMSQTTHQLYLRGKDNAGNWGTALATPVYIDRTAPVLGAVSVSPNPTQGQNPIHATAPLTESNALNGGEFWFGTADPGVGRATATTITTAADGKSVTLEIPTTALTVGATYTVNVRVQDKAGNWSRAVSTTFTVSKPNLIYRNNFEPADPPWSAATGTATNTATATLPTAWEPGSAQGMQVGTSTTTNPGAAYRTDGTPAAEPTYHARFVFNPNTLTTGANGSAVLTLFQARSTTSATTGAETFRLEFHRVGQGGAQVRLVLDRSGGGALTGTFGTLPTGVVMLQLDWTTTSLSLTVNGAPTQTLSFTGANTLRVETVNLGVLSPPVATRGVGYFDSFSSGRNTAA
jgi:hypothetical protein